MMDCFSHTIYIDQYFSLITPVQHTMIILFPVIGCQSQATHCFEVEDLTHRRDNLVGMIKEEKQRLEKEPSEIVRMSICNVVMFLEKEREGILRYSYKNMHQEMSKHNRSVWYYKLRKVLVNRQLQF